METKIMVVTRHKTKSTKNPNPRRPVIRLQGAWLDETGFSSGKLVAAEYSHGRIILRPLDSGQEGKGKLKASFGLFQVRRQIASKDHNSRIDIKGFWLERFGFTIGGVIAVQYEFGFIKILLVDLNALEKILTGRA